MNLEQVRDMLLGMPGSEEGAPFGPTVLVYRVGGKMFALLGLELPTRLTLKCDPDRAMLLRDEHAERILPGYHMNKKHWNTLRYEELPPGLIRELTHHSWDLVAASLLQPSRDALRELDDRSDEILTGK